MTDVAKFQPKTSDMKSDYFTTFVANSMFYEDVVYSPIEFKFTFSTATVSISNCFVHSVGECLENFNPIGIDFSVTGWVVFTFSSFRANSGSMQICLFVTSLDIFNIRYFYFKVIPLNGMLKFILNGKSFYRSCNDSYEGLVGWFRTRAWRCMMLTGLQWIMHLLYYNH